MNGSYQGYDAICRMTEVESIAAVALQLNERPESSDSRPKAAGLPPTQ
jgi:hypothetical protein